MPPTTNTPNGVAPLLTDLGIEVTTLLDAGRDLASTLGGTLGVESAPGAGARVRAEVPR